MEELTTNHQYTNNNLSFDYLNNNIINKNKDLIINVCETIIDSSIKEIKFKDFILISNLSILSNLKDEIFKININNNDIFGISKYKNKDNDYYHIDPLNWSKLNKYNKKEIKIKTNINEELIFISTNSKIELNRIENIFKSTNRLNNFKNYKLD